MQIHITLRKNRVLPGQFSVQSAPGPSLLGPVSCLGKADSAAALSHGNASRDPKEPFGDTPTGGYSVTELVSHRGETDLHTYGPHPSLLLDPQSGDALISKTNGRTGLMIHGGGASASGGLRPTHGCVRLSDENQRALIALVPAAALASIAVIISETP